MDFVIEWHLFLRLDSERKAPRVVAALAERAGLPIETLTAKRYWKDQGLIDVSAVSHGTAADKAHAVYQTLAMAQRIGGGWTIGGPSDYTDGSWEFECLTDKPSVPGVAWVSCRLAPAAPMPVDPPKTISRDESHPGD